ncbi:hypothetical protein GCM10020254_10730 [Streptomyces goshikiensis]
MARRCDEVLGAGGELLRLVRDTEVPGPRSAAGPAAGSAAPAQPPPSPPQSAGDCPYRGLAAFTPQDAGWFFGRERATAALVERVFERIGSGPLMLVAGSGAGKSSLLSAGLVPALRRAGGFPMPGADWWPVIRFTPTAHPFQELLDSAAKVLDGDPGITPHQLRERPEVLLDAVRRLSDAGAAPGVRPVLLVDQFEELFTLCSAEEERRAFVRVLCALAADRPERTRHDPAVVVLGVRADFSGNCLELPELARAFTDGLFVLPPMSVAELRESITRPAELAGLALEPGLVPLLLRDAGLREEPAESLRGDPASGPRAPSGALPLVSHALMATWQRREGATLTVAGYEHSGGIQGAIAHTAESVFAGLYPAGQRTIRRVLVRLVHVADGTGATRRRLSRAALMEQLADTDRAGAALDAFVGARLVTVDRDTVEITHEALLHAWPRLHGWIHADRAGLLIHQQLTHAADEWEREGRDPSVLYRGTRLETARSWAEELDGLSRLGPPGGRLPPGQPGLAGAAAGAGRAPGPGTAADAGRARRAAGAGRDRRRPRLPAAGGRPRAGTRRAFAGAGRPVDLAGGRSARGLDAARRGGLPYEGHPQARGALLSTQAQPFLARLGGHSGPVNAVAFGPGTGGPANGLLATGGSDGRVLLRRVANRRTVGAFTVTGRVRAVAFSPDGRTLAAASTDGPVHLWDIAGRRSPAVFPARTSGARALAFAPDGGTLAVAGADGSVQLWSTGGDHAALASLTGHTGRVNALAYSPDGGTLVSAGADQTVRLWDPAGGRQLLVLEGHTGEVLGAAFAPDGKTVATGGVDRTVRLWDVAGGGPPRR